MRRARIPESNEQQAREALLLPEDWRLSEILNRCLIRPDSRRRVTIEARRPNPYASSAPMEIVSCRLGDSSEMEVLCKYGTNREDAVGHRGGVGREALVYERVLSPLGLQPGYFGRYTDRGTGETWLFLEYLGDLLRLEKAPQPQALRSAAEWIAAFTPLNASRIGTPELAFLPTYDEEYYCSWVSRTAEFTEGMSGQYPWLSLVCARADSALQLLVDGPQCIVHGEYYPHNILCKGEQVVPVDWESAAVAAPEIDIASLIDGWSPARALEVRNAYCDACGVPRDDPRIVRRLAAAQMYWAFRWLGGKPERARATRGARHFATLRDSACALGLVAQWNRSAE